MGPDGKWLYRGLGNFQTHQSAAEHRFLNKDQGIPRVFGTVFVCSKSSCFICDSSNEL